MLFEKLESCGHAIILVGDFNPSIFHPFWLLKNNLINEDEANAADVNVTHKDVSAFTAGFISYEVTRDRLKISTKNQALFETVRDVVSNILKILRHTPVTGMGFNTDYQFALPESESVSLFRKIAPTSAWDDIVDAPTFEAFALRNITIKNGSNFSAWK